MLTIADPPSLLGTSSHSEHEVFRIPKAEDEQHERHVRKDWLHKVRCLGTTADGHLIGGRTRPAKYGGGWLFPVLSHVTHICSFRPSVTAHGGMRIR